MIICNNCGRYPLDETLPSCPECGAPVSSRAGDAFVNSSSAAREPSDQATPHDPPTPPVKQKDSVASSYEKEAKTRLRHWILDHKVLSIGLALLGIFVGLLGIFVSISGAWYFAEGVKGRSSPL